MSPSSIVTVRPSLFPSLHAALADREVGLANLQARLADRAGRPEAPWRNRDQLLVIEVHAIGRLVLDAVPKRLELGALQNGLPRFDDDALVGVLDIKLAGHLPQDLPHLRQLRLERAGNVERAVFERCAQRVLHLAFGVDEPCAFR